MGGFQFCQARWKIRQGGVERQELPAKGKGDGRVRGGAGIVKNLGKSLRVGDFGGEGGCEEAFCTGWAEIVFKEGDELRPALAVGIGGLVW